MSDKARGNNRTIGKNRVYGDLHIIQNLTNVHGKIRISTEIPLRELSMNWQF